MRPTAVRGLRRSFSSAAHDAPVISRPSRMLKTLNVTDAAWTVPFPHIGSIGHVLSFPEV